jgi:hypothetical protein
MPMSLRSSKVPKLLIQLFGHELYEERRVKSLTMT